MAMDLLSFNLNPVEVMRERSPMKFIRGYLKHHFNNKMTVLRGNLDYADKLVDDLGSIQVDDELKQQKLNAIHRGLKEVFGPMFDLIEKLESLQEDIDHLMIHVEDPRKASLNENPGAAIEQTGTIESGNGE